MEGKQLEYGIEELINRVLLLLIAIMLLSNQQIKTGINFLSYILFWVFVLIISIRELYYLSLNIRGRI